MAFWKRKKKPKVNYDALIVNEDGEELIADIKCGMPSKETIKKQVAIYNKITGENVAYAGSMDEFLDDVEMGFLDDDEDF